MSQQNAALPLQGGGRELLTNTRLTAFRRCSMEHALMYEEGLRPQADEEALRMGIGVHAGLEAWWHTVEEQDRDIESYEQSQSKELAPDEVDVAFTRAIAAVRAPARTDRDEVVQMLVEEMLRGYHVKWRYASMGFRVLGVELAFRAPLVNPDTGASSRTYELAGKIDVVAEDRKDGSRGVIEHKTSSEDLAPDADYWLKLAMDPQISFYVVGAEALGFEPQWTLYDVLGKTALRPKKATSPESRKFKIRKTDEEKGWAEDDARLLYAGQRAADEGLEEFRGRVRAQFCDEQGQERFYQRRVIQRTLGQMKDFATETWMSARVMRELQLAGRRPKNPNACFLYNRTCPFWRHCANGEALASTEEGGRFRRLSFVHPELEGAL